MRPMDFAVGSLCFAITSYLLGIMIAETGVNILAICAEIIMLIFDIGNIAMDSDYRKSASGKQFYASGFTIYRRRCT